VIQPVDESGRDSGEPLIAADRVSSREGDRVYFVRAREAAKAFPGKFAPLDATILAIVDGAQVDPEEA
jgi:microcompartment protein CcmK/EutM